MPVCNAVNLNRNITLNAKQQQALRLLSDCKYTLLSGGSRSGKTFVLVNALVTRAVMKRSRHAILRLHFSDVKTSVGMDTLPKVLGLMGVPYSLNKSDWVFTLANGSEIWLSGLDDKERVEKILGKEFTTIYLNEASQISYLAYQTAMTRLAENSGLKNRVYVDCNPPTKDHWLYALFVLHKNPQNRNLDLEHPENYGYLDVNPLDNVSNLPDGYIDEVLSGLDEQQRARFRDGLWQDRRLGAIWSSDMIALSRVASAPALSRVVVAVDPAVTAHEGSDETGIVVAGIASDRHIYVLGDFSMNGSPLEWGRRVAEVYRRFSADRVIGEVNQGGDLIESNLRSVDRTLPYKQVRATRGKVLRAEPVAALYEQGLVHHVGRFSELEQQMTEWNPQSPSSPDRLDALVWACTELTAGHSVGRIDFISGGGF